MHRPSPILRAARVLALGASLLALLVTCVVGALPAPAAPPPGSAPLRLLDLDGQRVDPFAGEAAARVFLFVRGDCPISNRYAPEMSRIFDDYAPRGVRFSLVYPDPDEQAADIRRHVAEYGYPFGALRDPEHSLVALAGARITPEVAVYRPDGRLAYRGRIDDRWADFGKSRPAATRQDLREALEAVLAGRPVDPPTTDAVGCYISDLR
jgi:hypothetical protein